jgi:hypothetical protein
MYLTAKYDLTLQLAHQRLLPATQLGLHCVLRSGVLLIREKVLA